MSVCGPTVANTLQYAGVEPLACTIVALVIVVFAMDRDASPAHEVVAKAWLALTVVISSEPANASPVGAKRRTDKFNCDLQPLIDFTSLTIFYPRQESSASAVILTVRTVNTRVF